MAENGWIKLHRKIRNNILWNKKPFSKGQAWVDLLLRASHNNHKVLVGNKPIELKLGQAFISKKRLAREWGWSRTKVTNFLNVLEGKNRNKHNQMLTTSEPLCKNETQKKTPLGIIISLTNYEFYQTGVKKKDTQKDIEKTPKRHQKDTYKNYKNGKNGKERIKILHQIENLLNHFPKDIKPLIDEYIELVKEENKTKKITDLKRHRLMNELYNIYRQTEPNEFKAALRITVDNAAPNPNYIKKVLKSRYLKLKMRRKRDERDAHN